MIIISKPKLGVIILISLLPAMFYSGYVLAIPAPSTNSVCEPGACSSNFCTFHIYISGSSYLGKNCSTGANDYLSTNAETVIQTVINQVITLGGGTIDIAPGTYPITTFSDTTYHAAITINTGNRQDTTQPYINIKIQGAGGGFATTEGSSNHDILTGGTVLDASTLDVLSFGLFKNGRVIFVSPPPNPVNGGQTILQAVSVEINDLSIIIPAYSQYGTGPSYTGTGMTTSQLFLNGNTATTSTTVFEFCNGIDGYFASALRLNNISVVNSLAAFSVTDFSGRGDSIEGAAAAFVYPENANQNQNWGENLHTWSVMQGIVGGTHLELHRAYIQSVNIVIYLWQGGPTLYITKMDAQTASSLVRHSFETQLSNSLTGGGVRDPVTDLNAAISGFPETPSSDTKIVIDSLGVETPNSAGFILIDDPSHPCNLWVSLAPTGSVATAWYGTGKNLHLMWQEAAQDPFLGWATTSPAVPSTGTAQTNTNPFPVNVYLTAINTLTAVGIRDTETPTVTKTFTATFVPGNYFSLQVNETIILTYSGAAPTWVWYGLNGF